MTTCKKQTTKKYLTRSSPAFPANECCGKRKRGNDGEWWISQQNKNGVCRWVPYKVKSKSVIKRKKVDVQSKVNDDEDLSDLLTTVVDTVVEPRKRNPRNPKVEKSSTKVATTCKKNTTKKYENRPSPAFPANECCGKRKRGNDGEWWISKPNKNGVCRWTKK